MSTDYKTACDALAAAIPAVREAYPPSGRQLRSVETYAAALRGYNERMAALNRILLELQQLAKENV